MCNLSGGNTLDVKKINILSTFCNGTIPSGDWHCCTEANRCQENKGDCDNDDQCMPGLSCGHNNCKDLFPTDSSENQTANQTVTLDSEADCCVKK